ncbi:collagen alpha-1(XX) chain-like isoform X1 [Dendronephthya gigantea]|uniref:collagen alpha-1(XX) chain-like isoform X1 n=2 Tax=Dendronephthya gigantea TaxID=151771 RepID=UPI00106928DB|nr:collagen alpha-1(XX) chain-like isoform X1 [Dendronephthya gigantea]
MFPSAMKLAVQFLFFAIAFKEHVSENISKDSVVCVNEDEMLNALKGRDGPAGPPGLKGNRGEPGDHVTPTQGNEGWPGVDGEPGRKGRKGNRGEPGMTGAPGLDGVNNKKRGMKGEPGTSGEFGEQGDPGHVGTNGQRGDRGSPGETGPKIKEEVLKSLLNDYYVLENAYFDDLYHVTSRDLTDGRSDTGGWGSETAKTGNYIQANYFHPVYATSVTLAGGFVPSWGHEIREDYGYMDLEYFSDKRKWEKIAKIKTPFGNRTVTRHFSAPVTAKYWRLISTENKWIGTTEFALKPLVKPSGV